MRFDSLAGRAIRLPLRLVPGRANLRILSGLNKGMRWRVGSAIHGCWLGHYESEIQSVLPQLVKRGAVCFDLGANAGFYTLAFSRLAGPTGRVIAFEPLAENSFHLLHHLTINRLTQALLIPVALSDADGLTSFEILPSRAMGRLAADGGSTYMVPTFRLDTLIEKHELPLPDIVKIDVEGAELAVLRGAESMLSKSRPTLLLSFHGDDLFQGCLRLLERHGYVISDLAGKRLSSTSPPVSSAIARNST